MSAIGLSIQWTEAAAFYYHWIQKVQPGTSEHFPLGLLPIILFSIFKVTTLYAYQQKLK